MGTTPGSEEKPDVKCGRCGKPIAQKPAPARTEFIPEPTRPAPAQTAFIPESKPPAPARTEFVPGNLPSPTAFVPTDAPAAKPPAVPEVDWSIGNRILGLYRVDGLLGQGGMGRVYKVRHLEWGLDLAVKTPNPEALAAAGGAESFEREAETWVNLGLHPHVVSCYYVRRVEGRPCVFAEHMAGGSLHDWIYGERGEPGRLYSGNLRTVFLRIIDLAIQTARGLLHAHRMGLVHLDVKPANILLTTGGLAKVTDFGLARAHSDPGAVSMEGHFQGTPQYCSPEQARGLDTTVHSDVWSWALCVLEMFKGDRTWEFGSIGAEALEEAVASGPGLPGAPKIPGAVLNLLRRCFIMDVAKRPGDFEQLAGHLIKIYEKAAGSSYPRPAPRFGAETADGLNNRAVSLLDLGRSDEASALWDQAVTAQPHHPESTYNLGLLDWRDGRLTDDLLLKNLVEAGRSEQGYEKSRYYQALVHLERDDCESAISVLDQVQLDVDNIDALRKQAGDRLTESSRPDRSLSGHEGGVNVVVFSWDNQYLLSGGEDRSIKLWNTADGECRTTIRCPAPVNSVALSRDAILALSAGGDEFSEDYAVRLWDMTTGKCMMSLPGHQQAVRAVVMSADGRSAFSAGDDGLIMAWDLSAGVNRKVMNAHQGAVLGLLHLSKSNRLLSCGSDRSIRIWDWRSRKQIGQLKGHMGRVTALSASRSEKMLLSVGTDNRLITWDLESGKPTRSLSGFFEEINSIQISPMGDSAVTAGADHKVRLWDLAGGRCLRTFEGHDSWVQSVHLNSTGKLIASAGLDKTIRLWKIAGNTPEFSAPMMLARVTYSEKALTAAAQFDHCIKNAKKTIQTGQWATTEKLVRKARSIRGYARNGEAMDIWRQLYHRFPKNRLDGAWESISLSIKGALIETARISPANNDVLMGLSNGNVRRYDLSTGKATGVWTGHEGEVKCLAIHWSGQLALTGSADRTLKIWDVPSGESRRALMGHVGSVTGCLLLRDGETAISTDDNGRIIIWKINSGRAAEKWSGHRTPINSLDISPDRGRIVTAAGDFTDEDNSVKVWRAGSREPVLTLLGHDRAVNDARWSPDGSRIVTAASDGAIKIWSAKTGNCAATLTGHDGGIQALDISSDGRFALTAGFDKTLRLWDLVRGEQLRVFEGHAAPLTDARFSDDGGIAVSTDQNGQALIWVLDWSLISTPLKKWAVRARPFIDAFVKAYQNQWIENKDSNEALSPAVDLDRLMVLLGRAGFGWLPRRYVAGLLGKTGES